MAILNSIRKRGFFLILIIALALFAFILSDIINKGGSSADFQNTVASINGTELSREDFMGQVEAYQKTLGPNASTAQAVNVVWERELRNTLFKQQAESLGLQVGEEQLNESLAISLSNNPTFQDENGGYSEARLIEYVASIQGNPTAKQQWDDFIMGVKENLTQTNYINLIRSGLVTTLAEGEQQYHFENDKIDIEYVQVPYTKIADEDVSVTDAEIEKYIRANASDFEVDPIVDIEYVTFSEEPSTEDIEVARTNLGATIEEFASTTDVATFVNEKSENQYQDRWFYQKDLPAAIKDTIMSMPEGTIYGPYKVDNTFNLSKVIAYRQLPDSVEARHILIPIGLNRTDSISRTKEQAKMMADSLLTVLKSNKSKFKDFVTQYSSDAGSIEKGGHYDWYAYNTMVGPFRDFTFENTVGEMGVVETQFGFHIIEVEGQKNMQKAIKIANIVTEIEPSETTINEVFSESAKFEEAARKGDFVTLAEKKGFTTKPVNKISALDASIPGVANSRSIINWAFQEDVKVGDIKRFNVDNTYVIVRLTRKSSKKALLSVAEASATVTPILKKEKKAKKIRESISGATLQEVASSQNVTVKTANALTRSNPTIAGAGTEPLVVGKAFGLPQGETSKLIDGDTGVYMVRVTSITKAPALDNYASYINQLNTASNASTVNANVLKALKKAADIEDNRASFY